jgi:hypothetical protein
MSNGLRWTAMNADVEVTSEADTCGPSGDQGLD